MKQVISCLILFAISVSSFCQTGRIGINTNSPKALLHVKDSAVVFTGGASAFLPASPGDPPVSGAGVRMMWYPDKAAFRVGAVSSMNWDRDSIGEYSFSAGYSNKAKGDFSVAIGLGTTATYDGAVSMGRFTNAYGFASTSMGNFSEAHGGVSTVMGAFTKAYGSNSVAMGFGTESIGDNSTAMGYQTIAGSYCSFVIGRFNEGTGNSTSWSSSDRVFAVGNGTSDDDRNNCFTVYKNGNMQLDGEITRPSSGAFTNLIPICYGSVSSAGVFNSGTSNLTLIHQGTGHYEIVIDNETYSTTGFIINVTPVNLGAPRIVTTNSVNGKIVVRVWDMSSSLVDAAFHFIVYKP